MKSDVLKYDVLVAGGGVAGCAAAWASAKNGAKTLLVERYGFLGGCATAALVNPFMSANTSDGKLLVGGFYSLLKEELAQLEGGILGSCFDSELMKIVLMELVLSSGADLLLHSWACGARADGGQIEVDLLSKAGVSSIHCKRLVDCSGDGDIAAFLGAEYESGDEEKKAQAVTLMFDVGGVDVPRALEYVKSHPEQMRFPKLAPDADIRQMSEEIYSVAGYYDFIAHAREKGEYEVPGDLIFYISRPSKGEVTFNTTHIGDINASDSADLTRAEVEGRRQMMQVLSFVNRYVPGFESARIVRTPTQVGIREGRRITGEYIFSAEDIIESRKFDDAICRLAYYADVHKGSGEGYTRSEEKEKILEPAQGDYYEIPYRCLLPRRVANILIAGKCVSSTQKGHGAIRIMPACMAMGQAAGTAAAISLEADTPPSKISVDSLLGRLRSDGALV